MTRQSIIITIIAFFAVFDVSAKKKAEYPRAEIKVGYTYHETFVRGSDGIVEKDIPFVLLANQSQAKFYCPHTEYKDSLQSTPSGRNKERKIFDAAFKKSWETKDESFLNDVIYKIHLYVFRSRDENETRVYDAVGPLDFACYAEPIDRIEWEIGDSVKMLLGYECVIAEADYHGRHWTAWFAPDVPIQEGPWKLIGLPGLILEARESSGQHWFVATGIERSNQEIYSIYPYRNYDKMNRIEMLRTKRYGTDHSSSLAGAEVGLNLGTDHLLTDEESKIDFLETDYH